MDENTLIIKLLETIDSSGASCGTALSALNWLTVKFATEGEKFFKQTSFEKFSPVLLNLATKRRQKQCEDRLSLHTDA